MCQKDESLWEVFDIYLSVYYYVIDWKLKKPIKKIGRFWLAKRDFKPSPVYTGFSLSVNFLLGSGV